MTETTETKRKIEVITLDSPPRPSENKKAKLSNPYSDYLLYSDDSGANEVVNDLVKTYINALVEGIQKFNKKFDQYKYCVDMFIETVEKFKKEFPKFLNQKHFKSLINTFSKDIQDCTEFEKIPDSNVEINIELRRIILPVTNKNGPKRKDEVEKTIEKLTNALFKIQNQISDLENRELSLDDLASESVFTKLPKLKNAQVRFWKKREALLKRSDFTGQKKYKNFSFHGTSNKEVNKIIQDYFISHLNALKNAEEIIINSKSGPKSAKKSSKKNEGFIFFTIIDLRNHLSSEIENAKIDFVLDEEKLRNIYKALLEENRKRRMEDYHDSCRTLEYLQDLKPATVANETDPNFNKEMEENKKKGEEDLAKLIGKYRDIDYERNGQQLATEGKSLGWDDEGESDSDSDEEYSEEEDANDRQNGDEQGDKESSKDDQEDNDFDLNDIASITDDDVDDSANN